MSESASVVLFDAKEHSHVTPYLAAIHASCITHDRTIATFLPPLSHEKLLSWWKERITEVVEGSRFMLLLVNELDSSERIKGPEIMGVVMLFMPPSETGPFRCSVEKLLVHKSFRGRGGARLLMDALESEALKRQRTMLVRCNGLDCRLCFANIRREAAGHRNRKPGRGYLQKIRIYRDGKNPKLWHQPHGRAQRWHVLLQGSIDPSLQRIIEEMAGPDFGPYIWQHIEIEIKNLQLPNTSQRPREKIRRHVGFSL